jgi:ABC-type glycerol-3-phosphate transport system substrate-binding protein
VNTYRHVAKPYQKLSVPECRDLVRSGRVAAALVDINTANTILDHDITQIDAENVGFANVTNIPWLGGCSFVMWDHINTSLEVERAALALVKFLTTKSSNLRWMQQGDLLPLRMDALDESYPPGNPLREPLMQAATQGRSYYNVSHWRRVESQIALELGIAIQHLRENPDADAATVLRSRLEPLARRLNMVLEEK